MISSNKTIEETNFSEIIKRALERNPNSSEAIEIARRNSQGKMWIIGGFVYRNIIKEIYGETKEKSFIDIDFLLENVSLERRRIYHPENWEMSLTRYGKLCFTKNNTSVDINYL